MVAHVNVNGTSLKDLVRHQLTLKKAYDRLFDALILSAPHPRDYIGRDAEYGLDRAKHEAEIERVRDKAKGAMDAALALAEQSGPEDWRSL